MSSPNTSDNMEFAVGFKRSSIFAKIVFVLDIIGLLFHMIGFYTVNWSTRSYKYPPPTGLHVTEYEGMWKFCWATFYLFKCENFRDHGSK